MIPRNSRFFASLGSKQQQQQLAGLLYSTVLCMQMFSMCSICSRNTCAVYIKTCNIIAYFLILLYVKIIQLFWHFVFLLCWNSVKGQVQQLPFPGRESSTNMWTVMLWERKSLWINSALGWTFAPPPHPVPNCILSFFYVCFIQIE